MGASPLTLSEIVDSGPFYEVDFSTSAGQLAVFEFFNTIGPLRSYVPLRSGHSWLSRLRIQLAREALRLDETHSDKRRCDVPRQIVAHCNPNHLNGPVKAPTGSRPRQSDASDGARSTSSEVVIKGARGPKGTSARVDGHQHRRDIQRLFARAVALFD